MRHLRGRCSWEQMAPGWHWVLILPARWCLVPRPHGMEVVMPLMVAITGNRADPPRVTGSSMELSASMAPHIL